MSGFQLYTCYSALSCALPTARLLGDVVTGYLTPAPPATQTRSAGDSAAISLSRESFGLPPLTKWEAELGAQWRLSSMPEKENAVEEAGAAPLPSHSLLYPMSP